MSLKLERHPRSGETFDVLLNVGALGESVEIVGVISTRASEPNAAAILVAVSTAVVPLAFTTIGERREVPESLKQPGDRRGITFRGTDVLPEAHRFLAVDKTRRRHVDAFRHCCTQLARTSQLQPFIRW